MTGPGITGARLEVYHHLLSAAAEEMGAALQRSAFSPNVKERRDFSCALFDADGALVSQAAVRDDLKRKRLVRIRDRRTPIVRQLRLAHRGLDRLSPAATALRDELLGG